jgi:hypothetical protein
LTASCTGYVSALRVFTEGEGRTVCTQVTGKDVHGETYTDVFAWGKQYAVDADDCIRHCQDMSDCGCYTFDEHRGNGCWIKRNPCGGYFEPVEPGSSPEMVSGECSVCPFCSPEGARQKPTVVIPFFERDLCKMKMTAASISKHDPNHELGDVALMWLSPHSSSEYANVIDDIQASIRESRGVKFHDFQFHFGSGMPGWYLQQVMKLKAAALVETEYYVVLDAKNTFIRDVTPDLFISPCNQGIVYATSEFQWLGEEKQGWYTKSADALGVSLPEGRKWSGSITPVVMHTKTVLDMLEHLDEGSDPVKLCEGRLCDHIRDGATEFALYYTYVAALSDDKCIHHSVDRNPAVSMWNGCPAELREGAAAAAATDDGVIMFGAQPSTMNGLSDQQRESVLHNMALAFSQAGLHNPDQDSEQSLADCVAQPE